MLQSYDFSATKRKDYNEFYPCGKHFFCKIQSQADKNGVTGKQARHLRMKRTKKAAGGDCTTRCRAYFLHQYAPTLQTGADYTTNRC